MAEELVLGLDTSTRVQVGIADGDQVLGSLAYDDPMRHVEQLAPLLAELAEQSGVRFSQLSKIIVGVGPGPYTGLRVGIATARTIGRALGIPVRGVCSLDALAAQWIRSDQPPEADFLIATDARRKETYWARYDSDGERTGGPSVSRPTELPALPLGGPATLVYPDLEATEAAPLRLDGGLLAVLGGQLADAGLEPLYLRNPDAPDAGTAEIGARPAQGAAMTADLSAPQVARATSDADNSVVEGVLRLEAAGFDVAERWTAQSWRSELTGDAFTVLLARDGAEVIGVLALRFATGVCELDRIVVDPQRRRQGIGRRLITDGLRAVAATDATEMILEVRSDNVAAVELYRDFGFRTVTVRRDYYRPGRDAMIMKLNLGGGR